MLYVPSGPRVTLFKPTSTSTSKYPTMESSRRYTFPSPVTSFTLRPLDDLMLVCGASMCRLINPTTKTTLRSFDGVIKSSITSCCYTYDGGRVVAGGDNGEGLVGNVKTGRNSKFKIGDGSVRSVVGLGGNLGGAGGFVTGCYDGRVKVWKFDDEQHGEPNVEGEIDVGKLVEFVSVCQELGIMVVGAGKDVMVYKIADQRLLGECVGHSKTVTSGCVTEINGVYYVVSASSGGQVKVHDLDSYKNLSTARFGSGVTGVDFGDKGRRMAVGLTEGVVVVKERKDGREVEVRMERKRKSRGGTYGHFTRGKNALNTNDAFEVVIDKKPKLSASDKAIKNFAYARALEASLMSRNVKEVQGVVEEIWSRNGLSSAVSGRGNEEVEELFNFVCRYILHPNYGSTVSKLLDSMIEVYGDEKGEGVKDGWKRVREKIREGIREGIEGGRGMGEGEIRKGL